MLTCDGILMIDLDYGFRVISRLLHRFVII